MAGRSPLLLTADLPSPGSVSQSWRETVGSEAFLLVKELVLNGLDLVDEQISLALGEDAEKGSFPSFLPTEKDLSRLTAPINSFRIKLEELGGRIPRSPGQQIRLITAHLAQTPKASLEDIVLWCQTASDLSQRILQEIWGLIEVLSGLVYCMHLWGTRRSDHAVEQLRRLPNQWETRNAMKHPEIRRRHLSVLARGLAAMLNHLGQPLLSEPLEKWASESLRECLQLFREGGEPDSALLRRTALGFVAAREALSRHGVMTGLNQNFLDASLSLFAQLSPQCIEVRLIRRHMSRRDDTGLTLQNQLEIAGQLTGILGLAETEVEENRRLFGRVASRLGVKPVELHNQLAQGRGPDVFRMSQLVLVKDFKMLRLKILRAWPDVVS